MKTTLRLFVILIILPGCFAPVNLNYDTARMMGKGAVEIQASGSKYYTGNGASTNNNLGARIGYGFSHRYNAKLRYEYIGPPTGYNNSAAFYTTTHYVEFDNKLNLLDGKIAVSLPVGMYINNNLYSFDPRFYFTLSYKNKFDFTAIPKMHVLMTPGYVNFIPGISAGIGLSSDLNKWALRPEFGYDRNLSFGVGFSMFLGGDLNR